MRILIIDTCYTPFLQAHYAARPELHKTSYTEQWEALMGASFGTADAYSHFLAPLGHPAHEVVANCAPMQSAWLRENRVKRSRFALPRLNEYEQLLLDQAAAFEADVIYVQDIGHLSPSALKRLGRNRLLVGQLASEPPPLAHLAELDLLLTSFPHFVERFSQRGVTTEYFRIGFDPRVLARLKPEPPHDVVFVGALGPSQHGVGNDLLEQAAERLSIDFWGFGLNERAADSAIRRRFHGEAWGLGMFGVIASARIALNRHIDVAEGYANNMRLYESTGVGSLLLTDAKRNLGDLFRPGEVVTYDDLDTLGEAVRYYLAHEEERAEIARAGQARTLHEHTYAVRMDELVTILSRYGAGR
jgi:spore maturation protein CgeB